MGIGTVFIVDKPSDSKGVDFNFSKVNLWLNVFRLLNSVLVVSNLYTEFVGVCSKVCNTLFV